MNDETYNTRGLPDDFAGDSFAKYGTYVAGHYGISYLSQHLWNGILVPKYYVLGQTELLPEEFRHGDEMFVYKIHHFWF